VVSPRADLRFVFASSCILAAAFALETKRSEDTELECCGCAVLAEKAVCGLVAAGVLVLADE
jgi:hypothetical protein